MEEAFKGLNESSVEIAASPNGYANYVFKSGTWLEVGKQYLIYAYERGYSFEIDESTPEVLHDAYKAFPERLKQEIREYNQDVPKYYASLCGRSKSTAAVPEDVEQLRMIFPDAQRFQTTMAEKEQKTEEKSFWQSVLSWLGF